MNKLNDILLVDDDERDVELTLEAYGESKLKNNIFVAYDGIEAMDYLYKRNTFKLRSDGNPAVILLDIKMPKMDGIQLLKEIKTNKNFKTIPVVMLTSSKEEKDMVKCYQNGANAYVIKPINFDEFVVVIKHTIMFWGGINQVIHGG